MTLSLASDLLRDRVPDREVSWESFLKERIDREWRPGEFDYDRLLFIPDLDSPHTSGTICQRPGCGIILSNDLTCPACRSEHRRSGTDLSIKEWLAQVEPKVRTSPCLDCAVAGCPRTHEQFGLCNVHGQAFKNWRKKPTSGERVEDWIAERSPVPLPAKAECLVGACVRTSVISGLCRTHANNLRLWRKRNGQATDLTIEQWLSREMEPLFDAENRTTYSSIGATPFMLLPEPLRWEFLYTVQQRDRGGRQLSARHLRGAYLHHRQAGTTTVVGAKSFGRKVERYLAPLMDEWQRHVDTAHRQWSGTDDRDRRLIYLRDVELRKTQRTVGPNAVLDLRSIEQDWIIDAIHAWLAEAPRGYELAIQMRTAWVLASRTLTVRGTPLQALGAQDIDAIVTAIRERWDHEQYQHAMIRAVRVLLEFGRRHEDFKTTWWQIPARFVVDPARHRPNGAHKPRNVRNVDEPYRFVPQPVIEHVMNHLHLLDRRDPYWTAEARAMIYLHERCGRRTGETIRLVDDCISYDNDGAPYLEWVAGKPPYAPGKRLPIHQETHDVIRQWQAIKREHGVESKWLFPARRGTTLDKHWAYPYLGDRLDELIAAIQAEAPLTDPVEGVEGNLIYFDLDSIDPYSFRHAFAQRFADATDAEGRPTTPPDVLQDYMGHKNFNTTMAYYEVSAKRRKQALQAVPPRRLNLHGQAVPVDRERDTFTKVAVTLGHCTEPQNIAAHGHGCMVNHACESCPFFLVDPLERDGMSAKRQAIKVQLERARAINAQQHLLDHYEARIKDCTTIIDGIDAYVAGLPAAERQTIEGALHRLAEVRRLATMPRLINLRAVFTDGERA
ncbi:tyrosine-type recombinase/integrase [Nocardioides kongjuensis]|uniref:Integrase n=1 Tax=Nocardioides kongjuensis TaxID=349522 RepID=A0A852RST5_9ACTN|nr:integrase [Nocardioides kongjuensis]